MEASVPAVEEASLAVVSDEELELSSAAKTLKEENK